MRLGFVAGLIDSEPKWIVSTAKKFSEISDRILVEFHEEDKWLGKTNTQARAKKRVSDEISKFCDVAFGMHIPWDSEKNCRMIDKKFDDRHALSWLRFCRDNEIGFANMHIDWGDGADIETWSGDDAARGAKLEIAAENLKDIFSFVEANGIKLSLETLPSCLYVERINREYFSFPAFPADYLKLQKLTGFDFGINPDVSHAGITWNNIRNGILYGVYDSDREWKGLAMDKFFEKFVRMARPMHQIHIADFLGYRNPSEHAIALGDGLLTDKTIKAISKNTGKKAAVVLEIKEDWATMKEMDKVGYLPETVRSLGKLSGFL